MTESPGSLDTIAVPSPDVPEKEVLDLLIRDYGLQGNLTQLVSERDQNFRVDATDGRQFVVRIANSAEPAQITDFHIQALVAGFDSIVALLADHKWHRTAGFCRPCSRF
jgi:Ser/Thr protein kinase RdoA (MazF antagonist)